MEELLRKELNFNGDSCDLKKRINDHAMDSFIDKCKLTLNIFHNNKRD